MRTFFGIMACVTWALWLGGIVALFIFVSTLFARSRPVAMEAAPLMFHAFERYQLALAAVALCSTVAWRFTAQSPLITVLFVLLGLAAVGAVVEPLAVSQRMEELRQRGLSGGIEFKRLHAQSMIIYTTQAIILLVAGLIFPIACRGKSPALPTAFSQTPIKPSR